MAWAEREARVRGEPTRTEQAELEHDWEHAVGHCFRTLGPDGTPGGTARIVLEQVADRYFVVGDGFRYLGPGRPAISVTPADLRGARTDLTSVPRALTWFVGRYGRHTPAALLHDAMLHRAEQQALADDVSPLPDYEEADQVFREALACLQVPPLRRTTMWAAVSFSTRLRAGGMATMGVVAWLVAFAVGTAALVAGLADRNVAVLGAALVAPLVGAVLWGRQYRAGVVASYMAVFVAAPTLLGAATFLVYRAAEWVILRLPRTRPRDDEIPYTGGM